MKPEDILSYYRDIARKEDIQLNVAAFEEMYEKLKGCVKDKKKLEKITGIYNRHKSMRDGCEINNRTIEDAIKEIEPVLL